MIRMHSRYTFRNSASLKVRWTSVWASLSLRGGGEDEDLLLLGVLVPLHHYLDVGGASWAARLIRPAGNTGIKSHTETLTYCTDRQTDRQTERETDRQTDRQTYCTYIHTVHTDIHTVHTDIHTVHTDRQTVHTDRQTDILYIYTDRQTDRQYIQTDRQTYCTYIHTYIYIFTSGCELFYH